MTPFFTSLKYALKHEELMWSQTINSLSVTSEKELEAYCRTTRDILAEMIMKVQKPVTRLIYHSDDAESAITVTASSSLSLTSKQGFGTNEKTWTDLVF